MDGVQRVTYRGAHSYRLGQMLPEKRLIVTKVLEKQNTCEIRSKQKLRCRSGARYSKLLSKGANDVSTDLESGVLLENNEKVNAHRSPNERAIHPHQFALFAFAHLLKENPKAHRRSM